MSQGIEQPVFIPVMQPRENKYGARIANPIISVVCIGERGDTVDPKRLDPFRHFAPLMRATDDRQPLA